jgi:hypothetical protein
MLGRNGALILGEMPTARHVQIVVLAPACIGTAVALFPVAKRQNEGVALGFAAADQPA